MARSIWKEKNKRIRERTYSRFKRAVDAYSIHTKVIKDRLHIFCSKHTKTLPSA